MAHTLELSFSLSHQSFDFSFGCWFSNFYNLLYWDLTAAEMDWVDFSCVCSESQEFSGDALCLQIYITRPVMRGAWKLFQEMSLDVTICVFKWWKTADKKHLLPNCFSQIPLPVNLRPRIQFDNYKNRHLSSLQRKTNIIRCLFQSVFKTNSLALSNLCWHKTVQVMLANSNTWWLLFGATTKTTWEDLCSCVPTFLYAGLTSLKPVQTVIFTGMQFISHPGYTFQSQPINHDFPDNALPLIRRWP